MARASSLLLIRHGQASFGSENYDCLSGLGFEQARLTGRYLRTRAPKVTAMYCGPGERHKGSASAIHQEFAGHGYFSGHALVTDALAEFTEAVGAFSTDGLQLQTVAGRDDGGLGRILEQIDAWCAGSPAFPGIEPIGQFRRRVGAWTREALNRPGDGRSALAITSGGVIAAAVCEVLALPDWQVPGLMMQVLNASITEFASSNGAITLRSFNETGHLPRHWVTFR